MKAFLLAAGNGTRLRPLTESTPKCVLPIQGVPLLEIWLRWCRLAGIDEVLINTHAHAAAVRDCVSRCRPRGVRVELFHERELLGSAGTISANRSWVAAQPYFWVLYADVLTNLNPGQMLQVHSLRGAPITIGVYRVPDPSRCGIATVDDSGLVTSFVEKPIKPAGNLAFSGVLLANFEMIEVVPERRPADLGHDVLPKCVGRMSACELTDYIVDIGTPANYEKAQKTWPGLSTAAQAKWDVRSA
jgi:mannose-1-phosphate guanylyltransferase